MMAFYDKCCERARGLCQKPHRAVSMHINQLSQYDKMMLEVDQMPPGYYVVAGILSWLLLAGFLVSPSTYASLRDSDVLDSTNTVGKSLMGSVRNVPLLYIASFICLFSTTGLGWLWWRWQHNYIWVTRYIIV